MPTPEAQAPPTRRVTRALLTFNRLKLGAWRGVLTAASALSAFLAGGVVFAFFGRPIWELCRWIWNIWPF